MNNPATQFLLDMFQLQSADELAALNWIHNSERDAQFLTWYRVELRIRADELANYQQANWGEESAFYAGLG